MAKIERKLMAHYIEVKNTCVMLGKDLEEYTVSMNAEVESKSNILGENSVNLKSYQPQASVSPYLAEKGDVLFDWLQDVIDNRKVLDDVKLKTIEVHLWDENEGNYVAYEEDAIIEISSYGGDTTAYQIPFNVHYCGNRKKGKFNLTSKTFTAD